MKMKFTAAFALLAWLLVAGWLASMVIAKPAVLRLGNQAEDTAAMAELRNSIARNHQVMESMGVLRASAPAYAGPAQLIALPVAAPVAAADGLRPGMAGGSESTGPVTHAVSLVLTARGRRVAVVDGRSVRPGSLLDGGARVAAIGQDWVRIVDQAGNGETYRVLNPLQATQAGSAP